MSTIEAKRDDGKQCWARLRLDSKERILVSLAATGVKIFKLRWRVLPGATLWESRSIVEAGEVFFDKDGPFKRPLDSVIDEIIGCSSAANICSHLTHRSQAENREGRV